MTADSNKHLTHLDESGNIHMVDVTDRPETLRESIAKARTTYKTGVDVEALAAATIAALTIYDMCKGVDTTITLEQAYVARKSGGKSGTVEFEPEAGVENKAL